MTQSVPGSNTPVADTLMAATPEVGQRTLDATINRSFTFLRGVSTNSSIRSRLQSYGFTSADQQEGVQLVNIASGFTRPSPVSDPDDAIARAAIVAVDDADEGLFRIINATLTRRFPAQAAFVLDGLSAVRGPEAVLSVGVLLDRLDALESGPARVATREQDHAALEMLAKRSITKEERTRLRGLVTVALTAKPTGDAAALEAEAERVRNEALIALRAWYREWSEVARAAVTRRDQLIRLGLANRRSPQEEAEDPEPEPATPVAKPTA